MIIICLMFGIFIIQSIHDEYFPTLLKFENKKCIRLWKYKMVVDVFWCMFVQTGVNSFQVYMAYKDLYQMSNSEVRYINYYKEIIQYLYVLYVCGSKTETGLSIKTSVILL